MPVLTALLAFAACRAHDGGDGGGPATVSRDQFKSLRWLEGGWVGTQPDGSRFYEDYRFVDDSTIRSRGFADSSASVPVDSGEIRLRGGRVTSGSGPVSWVVSSLDDHTVQFTPLEGAQNSFTWTRAGDSGWVASMHWPADGTRPARNTEYRMSHWSAVSGSERSRALIDSAKAAAISWLALMDQGKYGESRDSAAALLKHAVSRGKWERVMGEVRRPLEPFGARTLIASAYRTTLPGVPPGEYVVLQYRDRSTRRKPVVETVTPMKESDGRWRVSGYYIREE